MDSLSQHGKENTTSDCKAATGVWSRLVADGADHYSLKDVGSETNDHVRWEGDNHLHLSLDKHSALTREADLQVMMDRRPSVYCFSWCPADSFTL